ncbi:NOG1 family protein [Nanoarchaeota archaeon]
MGFDDIPKIEKYDWYLDLAFSRARKASSKAKSESRNGGRVETVKDGELARVKEIRRVLSRHLIMMLKSFPGLDDLTEFYNELVRATLDYSELKKSLGAVNWARKRIEDLSRDADIKLKKTQHMRKLSDYSSEYYGRVSSVMKQIKKQLVYLDQARMVMRDFPSIKSGLYTIAIAGFPNVGKTTLLTKLTVSRPEIAAYAFTTKKLNVGYANFGEEKVQFIDTPGTLDRYDKMNSVEKQAHLAVKYCADLVVFVIDISDTSYDLKKQKKLFEDTNELGKDVIVYVSKTDIADVPDGLADYFKKIKIPFIKDIETLKSEISLIMNVSK